MIIATEHQHSFGSEEANKPEKLKNEPAEKNVYRFEKETVFSDL